MAVTDETHGVDEGPVADHARGGAEGSTWLRGAVRPLRLPDMPAELRPWAKAALVAIGAWCFLLVLTAVGSGVQYDPRGFPAGLMQSSGAGPAFVRVVTVVSFGIALAMAAAAVWGPGWPGTRRSSVGRRLVRLAIVVVGLYFDVHTAVHAEALKLNAFTDDTVGDLLRRVWTSGLGWAVMVAVVASLFLPSASASARRLAVPLAVLPLVAWSVAETVKGDLTRGWVSNADWRGDPLRHLVDSLTLLLVLFLVWELLAWSELVADGSAFVARRLPVRRRIVVGLLAAKAVWLAAGLTGGLPGFLGGNAAVWAASADDGPASWVLGGVLAIVAVVALVHLGGPSREAELSWMPLLIVMVALVGPGIVAGVVDVVRLPLDYALPRGVVDLVQVIVVVTGAAIAWSMVRVVDTVRRPRRGTVLLIAVNGCLVMGYLAAVLQHFADHEALARIDDWLPFPDSYAFVPAYEDAGKVTAHYFLAPGVAFAVAVALAIRWRQGRPTSGRGNPGQSTDPPSGLVAGVDASATADVADPAQVDAPPGAATRAWVVPAILAVGLAGIALLYAVPRLPQVPLDADPEMIGASGDLLEPLLSDKVYPLEAAGWRGGWGDGDVQGTFEPVTFDAVFTAGLCWLAWRWWRADDEGNWRLLAFVLLASTVLAHSSTIRPDGWLGNHWYYAAFVVPIVWQLVVRGDELNDLVRRHPSLALLNVALVLLLTTVIGYRILTGWLDPSVEFSNQVFPYGRGITLAVVLVPLGAVAVARHLHPRST